MGIFDTTANTAANGFYGPQNNAYGGAGWGVDPNFMTPSYAAPYRPQYGGSGPYAAYGNPGFFASAYSAISPFTPIPSYLSPGQVYQPYANALAYRPMDAAMHIAQNYVLPGAAMWGINKYLTPNTGSLWGDFKGMFTGAGRLAGAGYGFGSGFGAGLAGGLGLGGNARAMSLARSVGGGIGSVLAGSVLPYAVAQMALQVGQDAVFDPYIAQRSIASDLRPNLANVVLPDSTGVMSRGGRGLSARDAGRISSDIVNAGIKDFTFGLDDYTEISSLAGRAGLLDNAKAKTIASKIKGIVDQVKFIQQIANDPSYESAIEELSKLELGGASLYGGRYGQAGTALNTMGMSASAAGTTVRRLMDRVGGQGQMLYSMNGMTPYLGQVAAADIYAGFSVARRSGLVSDAHLARLGGLEGATQAALTGSINALQTPYAQMVMYNRYMAGAQGQSIGQTVGTFGQLAGGNPIEALGRMAVHGPQMSAAFLNETGGKGVEDMAIARLQAMGQRPGPSGKYSAYQIAAVLQRMGMGPSEVQAFLAQRTAQSDEATLALKARGYSAQAYEQTLGTLEQEGLVDTPWARVGHSLTSAYKSAIAAGQHVWGPLAGAADALYDSYSEGLQRWHYGSSYDTSGQAGLGLGATWSASDLASAGFTKSAARLASIERNGTFTSVDDWGGVPVAGAGASSSARARGVRSGEDLYEAPFKGYNAYSREVSQEDREVMLYVQNLALSGSGEAASLARKFMSSGGSPEEKKALLSKVLRAAKDSSMQEAYSRLYKNGGVNDFLTHAAAKQTELIGVVRDNSISDDSVLGNILGSSSTGLSSYTDMRAIGKMYRMAQLHAAGGESGIDESNVDEYIAKDPTLAAVFKGKSGSSAMAYLRDVLNKARGEGRLASSSIAAGIGSVEDVDKNPMSAIADPKLRAKYMAAKSRTEKESILKELTQVQAGGSLTGPKVVAGQDLSIDKTVLVTQAMMEAARLTAANARNVSTQVDYKSFNETMSSFDRSVDKFSTVINTDLVNVLKGATPTPGATPPQGGAPDLFKQLYSGTAKNMGNSLLFR